MRRTLRKFVRTVALFVGVLWIIAILLVVSTDIQILELEEQQKLKEGKLFWEWNSAYGPFSMHYIEKGEGEQHVFLLHGFRAHSYTWKELIHPLAAAGYHVWAIDLIGYGLSDKPDLAIYNVDFFVQQVHAFMEAKNIQQAHLVGNSMGGGLALAVALAHPQKIHSLTLLSALGYPLDIPLYISLAKHVSQIWVPFLGPTMVRHCLKQIVYNAEKVTDEQVEAYSLPYRFPGGVAATIFTLRKYDNQRLIEMGQRYHSLPCPILIIWGDHDTLIPISHYEKFLKDFPNAECRLIKNCGHIPQEEEPEEVLSTLLPFLEKNRSFNFSLDKMQP